jgi:cyclic-di-GMP phosphodiesterase TipF (flagellum assembly factor)
MKRIADLFIAGCILAVSLSAGAVTRYQFGFGWESAAVVATGLLLALMILQMQTGRFRDRDRLQAEVSRMAERIAEVGDGVANLERRVSGLEAGGQRRSGKELDSVVAEIEVIGTLVRQVVESVADLEQRIGDVQVPAPAPAPAPVPRPAAQPVARHAEPSRVAEVPAAFEETLLVPKRFAHLGEAGHLDQVRRAIDAGRIEIYLQPIVTLPQRRIRYYEALTRLRTEDGETLYPADYMPIAERGGVLPALDTQIVIRAVQILRRLTARSKDVGLFCNLTLSSFADAAFAREMLSFLEANRSLADSLILEFSQAGLKQMGPIEYEGLRGLQSSGFRFSIDQVTDLRPSFQILAERGFRFAKISSDRILNRMDELATDIHPADLADFFARFGIELIVDRVESEAQVVDILDYRVRYGQGFVFSPPRPVRSEVLQPTPEPEPAPVRTETAQSGLSALAAGRVAQPRGPAGEARFGGEARPAADPRAAGDPRRSALGRAIAQRQ